MVKIPVGTTKQVSSFSAEAVICRWPSCEKDLQGLKSRFSRASEGKRAKPSEVQRKISQNQKLLCQLDP